MNTTTKQDASEITHSDGGSMYAGKDAVSVVRAYYLASALSLYAKCGIRPTRGVGPRDMMKMASELTGKKFAARDYSGAAAAVKEWASLMRSGIPESSSRPEDQP